jgi:hypothetical protein
MTKINFTGSVIRSLVLTAFCLSLFSFSEKPGGDSFTIHRNDKLLLQQHLTIDAAVKTLVLDAGPENDVLKVYFSHCGKIGTSRNISFRSEGNKTVKTWHFPDSPEHSHAAMTINVGEIVRLQQKHQTLMLHYASKELPAGKVLVAFAGGNTKASIK